MKLYTEEDVLNAIAFGYHYCNKENIPSDNIINTFIEHLTPIELPSDEEIEEYFKHGWGSDNHGSYAIFGAKWMRDKIQGGNK